MLIREGVPYVLEVNTLPGLTKQSAAQSAAAAGISFAKLLDTIIDLSLKNVQGSCRVYESRCKYSA